MDRMQQDLKAIEETGDLLDCSGRRSSVKPPLDLKTNWTWEEWLASRKARRQAADRISPRSVRRRESSSDRRLRAAFKGERGPDFGIRTQGR
jgi:hypothetical protein